MLKKSKGEQGVECDECGKTQWGGTLEFREFLDDIKSQGWKIRKDGEDWTHTCPECQED